MVKSDLENPYPPFSVSSHMIRVINAVKSEPLDKHELLSISGYKGSVHMLKNNVIARLVEADLLDEEGGCYRSTRKGDRLVEELIEYRDLDFLDARKIDSSQDDEKSDYGFLTS